jgi:hypothetical protein
MTQFKDYYVDKNALEFLIHNIKESKLVEKLNDIKHSKERMVQALPGNKIQSLYRINLSDSENEVLMNTLSDILTDKGLQKNYEPNELGLYVEELIGIFNPYQ